MWLFKNNRLGRSQNDQVKYLDLSQIPCFVINKIKTYSFDYFTNSLKGTQVYDYLANNGLASYLSLKLKLHAALSYEQFLQQIKFLKNTANIA